MISLSQQMELNHYSRKAEFAQNLMSTICGEHRLDTIYKDNLDFTMTECVCPIKKWQSAQSVMVQMLPSTSQI
jgi:hypothetical protein